MADGDGDEGPELTDERWPTSPGDVDTASANNLKHEKWLGVPEWPSASNEWLSRRGHPLTPSPGEPYFHHWVEERPLASVRLGASDYQHRSRSSRSSCAATLWIPSPAPVPGVAPDPTRARAASSHVIQGGAAEAIDLERMSVGQRRVHPRAASTPKPRGRRCYPCVRTIGLPRGCSRASPRLPAWQRSLAPSSRGASAAVASIAARLCPRAASA
jgi:hypothetical protein